MECQSKYLLYRELEPALDMDIGYDTVVVECKYFTDDDNVGLTWGETDHCFGSITIDPPIDLNTCTSMPSEITLEVC